jgi:glucose-1-phosphate thymidylyltransferase
MWYLRQGLLDVIPMGRGIAWLDTGTPGTLINASNFVEVVQHRQGFYIGCIEEIAWRRGFISLKEFQSHGEALKSSDYGKYILKISSEG